MTTALDDSVETRQSQPLKEIPALRVRDGMGGIRTFRGDQLGFLRSGIDQFGDIYRFRLLNMRVVMLNHPDYIRHVLVDKSEQYDKNAAVFRIARPVLREGLIATADMELWRRQRRMMAPYFTPRMVSKFARNMTGETVSMLERWESRPDADAPLDVTDEFGQLALRIVSRSLFNAEVGDAAQAFERAFQLANTVLGKFFSFPFPPLSF
ncbi:MAG: cytochrome P450, partial [Streptomyces albidoflavus]